MDGCSISDLTRSIRMHARYAEGSFPAFLDVSQHMLRGVEATGITPDLDYLARVYYEAECEISAEGMSSLFVPLGKDPFGEGARIRNERARGRENFTEHEDRLAGRRGSVDFPHDLTGGAFDTAPSSSPDAARVAKSRKSSPKQKAVRHA
jgi:hypothetical protein